MNSLRKLIDAISLLAADTETEWIRWIPGKANILLWRLLNNRLPTKDNLITRGVSMASTDCPLCVMCMETLDHLMTSCSTSRVVNAYLLSWVDWWPSGASGVQDLWRQICSIGGDPVNKKVRKVIGAAFYWNLWTQRNTWLFTSSIKKEKEFFRDIQFLAFNWIRCRYKGGKTHSWDSWSCNPDNAVSPCNLLAPR